MSARVITFPACTMPSVEAVAGTSAQHPAAIIAQHIVAQYAERDATHVFDALIRVLAALIAVNVINRTEGIELAQSCAADLEALVRDMLDGERLKEGGRDG